MSKKIISCLLVLAIICCFAPAAFAAANEQQAAGDISGFGTIQGSKIAVPTGNTGEYEITVSVPGVDTTVDASERLYNEVIVMVDGSNSQDERTGNFTRLRKRCQNWVKGFLLMTAALTSLLWASDSPQKP